MHILDSLFTSWHFSFIILYAISQNIKQSNARMYQDKLHIKKQSLWRIAALHLARCVSTCLQLQLRDGRIDKAMAARSPQCHLWFSQHVLHVHIVQCQATSAHAVLSLKCCEEGPSTACACFAHLGLLNKFSLPNFTHLFLRNLRCTSRNVIFPI